MDEKAVVLAWPWSTKVLIPPSTVIRCCPWRPGNLSSGSPDKTQALQKLDSASQAQYRSHLSYVLEIAHPPLRGWAPSP